MHIRTTFTFATLGLGALSTAIAGPSGAVVVGGQGAISTPSSTTTVVDQSSQNLQVNWNTFNVAANENVRFHQPSSSAVAFNRILDQNPSQIFGRIDANGQVVLVNPNGLLIGRTAQLNVNSLVVSSLDAIDFDASSGRYRFSTNRLDPGAVVNEGTITAGPGGSVTLLGGYVSNSGSIVADYGTVNLAAGRAATLDLAGDGLLRLEVGADLLSNGSGAVAAVDNSGNIQANGGQVLLTANAVRDVFANLINNSGVVRANRIDNSGGTIKLLGPEGTVLSSGVLDASAGDAASTGGSVEMLGERVGLTGSAVVDVSGAVGGGTALIGGDYQGHNPDVLNAKRAYVGVDAAINADAGATGDGGRVIVWSDDFTRFDGQISARGGLFSGNGGFAEVSGKQSLAFTGGANMTAAHGAWGTLLLDPDAINIDSTAGPAPALLADGVYDFTEDDGTGPVSVGVDGLTTLLHSTDVTLNAKTNITQTADLDLGSDALATRSLSLVVQNGTMSLGNITMNGGSLSVTASGAVTLGGLLRTTDKPVTVDAGSILMTGTAIDTGTGAGLGTVSLHALTGDIEIGGQLKTGDATVSVISDNGLLTMDAGSLVNAGNAGITLQARNAVSLSGTVIANNAPVQVTSTNDTITMLGGASSISAGNGTVTLSASGDVTPTNIQTSGSASITSTAGDIVDDPNANTFVRAGTLTLSANGNGHSIGSSPGHIDTNADTLIATAKSGVYITEEDALTLDNVNAGGGEIAVTASGAIAVGANKLVQTINAPITLTANGAGHGITMASGSSITAGNGAVTLTGSGNVLLGDVRTTGNATITSSLGNIVENAPGTQVQANGLTLSAVNGAIGASVAQIETSATMLKATAANGVFVKETDDVTLDTTSAGSGGFSLIAGGDITVGAGKQVSTTNAPVSMTSSSGGIAMGSASGVSAGNATVTLLGHNDVTVSNIVTTGNASITSQTGNILDDTTTNTFIQANALALSATSGRIGDSGAGGELDTQVSTLKATALNGIYVAETDGVTLDDIDAGSGAPLRLTAGGDIALGANKTVSATDAPISITSTLGGIAMGNGSAINAGNGAVTLNGHNDVRVSNITTTGNASIASTNGNIVDDPTTGTVIKANGLTLSATTGKIGDSATGADIDTQVATLTATSAHGVYVTEQDALTVANVGAGDGAIAVTADGALTLDNNAVVATSNAPVSLTSTNGALSMSSGSAITAGSGAVALSAKGNVGVRNITTTGNATIASTTGNITHTAGTLIQANALTLTALAGAIGASGSGSEIDTQVTSLKVTAAHGAYVNETDGVTLDDVSAGDGAFALMAADVTVGANKTIATTNAPISIIASTTSISMAAGSAISAGSGTVDLSAFGDVGVTDITTTGSASIASTTGNIVDDSVAGTRIRAGALTLNAAAGAIGGAAAGADVDTQVTTLDALAANGVYVRELDGVTLQNVRTTTGDVSVTSDTGDIVVASVMAPNQVTLAATAGAIADDGSDATVINGVGGVSLSAATGVGTVTDFATVAGSSIDVLTSGALTASVTSNTGQINLNISGTPALGAGAITLGSGTGRGGTVILQSAGDLNVAGLTAGAINIGAGNTTRVGLVSAGVLTLPAVGGFTDSPANSLLVRGATDVVDNDATPRDLAFTANALNFQSGSAGGATVLDTSVSRLDATIGNNRDLTVNEADGIALGTVSAANLVVSAGGAISDDGDDSTRLTAFGVKLTGTALGAAGNELDTDAMMLDATALAGGVFLREVDDAALTAHALGGAVDVRSTGGALTVTEATGTGVALTSGAGSLTVFGAIEGGSGPVNLTAIGANSAINLASTLNTTGDATLTAGGAIVVDSASHIAARNLTVTGSGIANGSQRLNTSVDTLTATARNGDIFIAEDDALSLSATATGGQVDARTTNGSLTVTSAIGNGVTLFAGGDGNALTVNGAVNGGGGDVALVASGAGGQIDINNTVSTTGSALLEAGSPTARGAITSNGSQVAANLLFASGASIGSSGSQLNTAVTTLSAIASNGGVYIQEADGLALTTGATGAVQVATLNGALNVSLASGDGVNLAAGGAGNDLTVAVGGGVTGGTGPVTLTAGGGMTLDGSVASAGNVTLTTAGAGTVALNSFVAADQLTITAGPANARGAIVAGAGNQIMANAATLRGSAIGADTARLSTTLGSLDAQASNGGIFVTETDGLTLNAATTNGALDVRTSSGALTVASAIADGDVTLESADAIVAAANSNVAGNTVNLKGSSIGSGGARLNTAATSLNVTSTNGGAFINEADGLALTGSASGGALDVQAGGALNVVSANGDGVVLATTGAGAGITANGAVNAGAGPLTLAANGAGSGITLNSALSTTGNATLTAGSSASRGAIAAGAGSQISAASLTATGSSIGAAGSRLNTSVGSLNATSTNGGTFVTEADALTLTANATGGALDVQTANGALVVNGAKGAGVTLTAGGAGSGIALNGAVDAGTADVTLAAGTVASRSAITGGSGNLVTGTTLTAVGSSMGSASGAVNTSIDTLNANASTGDVYVREQNGIRLADVRAGGKVDIGAASGNITVSSVSASGDVSLGAGAGAIADDGDDSTRLAGGAVTLLARSIGGPSTLAGATLDSKPRLDIDATSLDATSTAGGIFIDSRNGLASTSLHASGGGGWRYRTARRERGPQPPERERVGHAAARSRTQYPRLADSRHDQRAGRGAARGWRRFNGRAHRHAEPAAVAAAQRRQHAAHVRAADGRSERPESRAGPRCLRRASPRP
ncbi:MAG: filamentous hemagglutinin N-terminal domain-containing protein [Gammaproteobacteria bacterium]